MVDEAIDYWRACSGYGTDFPALVIAGEPGIRSIRIHYAEPSAVPLRCGMFLGHSIVLHDEASDHEGRPMSCGALAQNLAHELGHVLGLGHLEDRHRCRTHIMGPVTRSSMYGRRVSDEECAAAGARWLTEPETERARQLGYVDGTRFRTSLESIDRLVNAER
jgi:hypothetical protein